MSDRRFSSLLWALMLVQAALTIAYIFLRPVCVADEPAHIYDVLRYYFVGIDWATLRDHLNPAAPGAYLWSALGAKLFGMTWPGLRTTLAVAWGGIALVFFALARVERAEIFVPAALFTLFLYLPSCVGKWMTEMPGFFFLFASIFFYLRAIRAADDLGERRMSPELFANLVGVSIGLGLSLFCKQFFLAAVPAMIAAFALRTRRPFTSALIGVAPAIVLLFLFVLWHGITSPYAREVDTNHASISINWMRGWNAAALTGLYAIVGLPWRRRDIFNRRNWAIFLGLGILTAAVFARQLSGTWPPGIVKGIVDRLAQMAPWAAWIVSLSCAVAGTALFGFLGLSVARGVTEEDGLELFSIFFVVLFVAENLFAGGQIPFYERYLFNLVFFVYYVLQRRARFDKRIVVAAALVWVTLGQAMLWKNRPDMGNPARCDLKWPKEKPPVAPAHHFH